MSLADMYLAENAYYMANNYKANRHVILPMMPVIQPLPVQRSVAKKTQKLMQPVIDFSNKLIEQRDARQARIDRRTERLQEHGRFAVKEYVKRNNIYRWLTTPLLSTEQRHQLRAMRAVLP